MFVLAIVEVTECVSNSVIIHEDMYSGCLSFALLFTRLSDKLIIVPK